MLKEYELDEQDIKIINELDTICGVAQNKEVLRDMIIFSKLKEKGEIEFGNFNILVRRDSAYNFTNELLKICGKLLVKNGVIDNNEICYLDRVDLGPGKKEIDCIEEVKESIVVINERRVRFNYSEEAENLARIANNLKGKILVFEDTFFREGEADAELGDVVSWRMTMDKVSLEDKMTYCRKIFEDNSLSYNNKDLEEFADQPFWQLKKQVMKVLVDCKSKKITFVKAEMLKERKNSEEQKRKKHDETKENIIPGEDLDSLIGLDEVKQKLSKIVNYVKLNKERGEMPTLHMCFTGNPGTGKTSIARIIGKMFAEEKILKENGKFVEVHGRDLVGKYVGWTAKQVKDTIRKAMGGVLFIDEAYSLVPDRRGSFEDEAIATLIKEMEDHRSEICIIIAGYTEEMKRLIKLNPGFESRIQFTIDFPDYNENELYQIFENMCKKEKYKITTGCKDLLIQNFKQAKLKESFGNGRYVRNIFEKIKFEQADRVIKTNSKNVNTITLADIKHVLMQEESKEMPKRVIGFGA